MNTYKIYTTVEFSGELTVEAETPEQAAEVANRDFGVVIGCNNITCSNTQAIKNWDFSLHPSAVNTSVTIDNEAGRGIDDLAINPLAINPEYNKAVCVSTAHISIQSSLALSKLSKSNDMIHSREFGYIIKLFEDLPDNLSYQGVDDSLNTVIKMAHKAGFRLLEIDADAKIYDDLPQR